MKIKSNELTAAVEGILADFSAGVSDGVEQAVADTAKAALKEVRERSPRRTGAYAKGWTVAKEKTGVMGKKTTVTLYNKKHYRLTHLLENGHQKAGGGRVEGTPHIRPAEELAEGMLPGLIQKVIEEASG